MAEYRSPNLPPEIPNLMVEPVRKSRAVGEAARDVASILAKLNRAGGEADPRNAIARELIDIKKETIVGEALLADLSTQARQQFETETAMYDIDYQERSREMTEVQKTALEASTELAKNLIRQDFVSKIDAYNLAQRQLGVNNSYRINALARQYADQYPEMAADIIGYVSKAPEFLRAGAAEQSAFEKATIEAIQATQQEAVRNGTTFGAYTYSQRLAKDRDDLRARVDTATLRGQIREPERTIVFQEYSAIERDIALYGDNGPYQAVLAISNGLMNPIEAVQTIAMAKTAYIESMNERKAEYSRNRQLLGEEEIFSIDNIVNQELKMLDELEGLLRNGNWQTVKEIIEDTAATDILSKVSKYMFAVPDEQIDTFVNSVKGTEQQGKLMGAFFDARKAASEAIATLLTNKTPAEIYNLWGVGGSSNREVNQAFDYLQSQFVTLGTKLERDIGTILNDGRLTGKFLGWIRGLNGLSDQELIDSAPAWTYLLNNANNKSVMGDDGTPLGIPLPPAKVGEVVNGLISNDPEKMALTMSNPSSPIYSSAVYDSVSTSSEAIMEVSRRLEQEANITLTDYANNSEALSAIKFDPNQPKGYYFEGSFKAPIIAMSGAVGVAAAGTVLERMPINQRDINSEEAFNRQYDNLLAKLQAQYVFLKRSGKDATANERANAFMSTIGSLIGTPETAVAPSVQTTVETPSATSNMDNIPSIDDYRDRIGER